MKLKGREKTARYGSVNESIKKRKWASEINKKEKRKKANFSRIERQRSQGREVFGFVNGIGAGVMDPDTNWVVFGSWTELSCAERAWSSERRVSAIGIRRVSLFYHRFIDIYPFGRVVTGTRNMELPLQSLRFARHARVSFIAHSCRSLTGCTTHVLADQVEPFPWCVTNQRECLQYGQLRTVRRFRNLLLVIPIIHHHIYFLFIFIYIFILLLLN